MLGNQWHLWHFSHMRAALPSELDAHYYAHGRLPMGGGSDPQWERRRPVSARLHPDVEELILTSAEVKAELEARDQNISA